MRENPDRLRVSCARIANHARQSLDGLEILRKDIDARIDHGLDVRLPAAEVRGQRLDLDAGTSRLDGANAVGVMAGAAVGLRGTIIGIDNFYSLLRRNKQRHMYRLALGASILESLLPYLRASLKSALQPTLATMATMGIVFLPGMMTGQILGGLSPLLAIKYQMVIMITIFVSTAIAINLTILLTMRTCFDEFGLLKKKTFSG